MKRLREGCNSVLTKAYLALQSEKGQGLVEYGLIVVLIAVIVIFMLKGTGKEVNTLYSRINSGMNP